MGLGQNELLVEATHDVENIAMFGAAQGIEAGWLAGIDDKVRLRERGGTFLLDLSTEF